MNITIERVTMSGQGPKYLYKLVSSGKTLFAGGEFGSFLAWTKKKDAQAILDAIKNKGLEFVESKLERKAF